MATHLPAPTSPPVPATAVEVVTSLGGSVVSIDTLTAAPTAHRMQKLRVKTVILSDVHLGTTDCRVREANHFLKNVRCEKLILNGDIIDGWQLRRAGQWTHSHTRFIRIILKKLEKRGTEVIYLRGNHDDILSAFLPLNFENLSLVEDYVHAGLRGNYLVLHGDIFDTITKNFVFLAHLGDWGYRALLRARLAVARPRNRWPRACEPFAARRLAGRRLSCVCYPCQAPGSKCWQWRR